MYIYMYMCTCTVCQWQHLTGHRGAHISAQEGKRCMHTEHCTHVQCILNDAQGQQVSSSPVNVYGSTSTLLRYIHIHVHVHVHVHVYVYICCT